MRSSYLYPAITRTIAVSTIPAVKRGPELVQHAGMLNTSELFYAFVFKSPTPNHGPWPLSHHCCCWLSCWQPAGRALLAALKRAASKEEALLRSCQARALTDVPAYAAPVSSHALANRTILWQSSSSEACSYHCSAVHSSRTRQLSTGQPRSLISSHEAVLQQRAFSSSTASSSGGTDSKDTAGGGSSALQVPNTVATV